VALVAEEDLAEVAAACPVAGAQVGAGSHSGLLEILHGPESIRPMLILNMN
jgi:hypothetical protein